MATSRISGVIEHVRSTSGGRFDYPDGTVYPALHRLEAEGLLRSRWNETDRRRRRIYEITARGDRIQAVGENAEILKLKGPETQLIDLGGKFLMP